MSYLDFKPSTCRKCGNLVWDGISATSACQVKLDTKRLNLIEEIQALASGIATYQIHRTAGSFEATRRMVPRMGEKDPIVLATHTCYPLTVFAEEPPHYWGKPKLSTTSDEVPF
jgi:hypothetical protein